MHQSGARSAQCLHNHAFFEESNIAFLQRSFFEILIFFSVIEIYIKMLKISNSWVSVPQMAPYLMFILVCFLDKMHNGFTCPLHYHILLFRAAINFTRIRNIIRLYRTVFST